MNKKGRLVEKPTSEGYEPDTNPRDSEIECGFVNWIHWDRERTKGRTRERSYSIYEGTGNFLVTWVITNCLGDTAGSIAFYLLAPLFVTGEKVWKIHLSHLVLNSQIPFGTTFSLQLVTSSLLLQHTSCSISSSFI